MLTRDDARGTPLSPRRRDVERDLNLLLHCIDPTVRLILHGKSERRFTWNGSKTLAPNGKSYEESLHDVAHFLIASPWQRGFPEFGLGPDPYRETSGAPRRLNRRAARGQEEHVAILQAGLSMLLGLDLAAVEDETRTTLTAAELHAMLLRTRRCYPNALPTAAWDRILETSSARVASLSAPAPYDWTSVWVAGLLEAPATP